jgi:hypothetical protein
MKFFKKVSFFLFAFTAGASSQLLAQDDLNKLLSESVQDGEKLIGAYVSPLMKGLSSGLNQGWYNTAKPHKIAGFDLTFTVNAMRIPDKEMFFNTTTLGLTKLELDPNKALSPDYPNLPTIIGPARPGTLRLKGDNSGNSNFEGPEGLDLKGNIGSNTIPLPMVHLGFGLPKGTDIKFRFVPKTKLGDNSDLNLIGIGIMHDVKQWIPGIKNMPFDLSGFIGYTKFKMNSSFDDPSVQNGKGAFEMNATTIQALISKKISVLTVYGGLGYNIAKSNLAMLGTYTLDDDPNQDGNTSDAVKVKDPINLNFAASGPRATAGFRLKLAIFTLHADYTLQKYSCLSFGFGFAVR